jgi:branched-chain amino acid transport system substrate-binding protein
VRVKPQPALLRAKQSVAAASATPGTDNKGINPNLLAVGGYDGVHLIYEVLKKTGGKADADAFIGAAKGMAWKSPRSPIAIDPETRDIVQTIYIRRVEEAGGDLTNVEIDKIDSVKDPGR